MPNESYSDGSKDNLSVGGSGTVPPGLIQRARQGGGGGDDDGGDGTGGSGLAEQKAAEAETMDVEMMVMVEAALKNRQ